MRKNLRWIILFAALLAVYGYTQYEAENRDPTFETQLLDFSTGDIKRILISAPDQPDFKLLREGTRWLLSYEHVHVEAYKLAVAELLQILKRLSSSQIIATEVKDWETYGLTPEKAIQICLEEAQKPVGCLSFGRFTYVQDQQNLRTFVRLNQGKEVYTADGLFLSKIEADPRAYRPNLLWLVNGDVQRLDWQTPDTSHYVYRDDSSGWHSSTTSLDTIDWINYIKQISNLRGTQFADDFNELSAPDLFYWQLRLSTKQDTFVLHCYQDSTRLLPYIYHTRSQPEQWLADDGQELYPTLIAPWLSLVTNTGTNELE